MPRVLYLTKVYPFPPSNEGDAVYSRGVISAIEKVCDVTVICADNDAFEQHSDDAVWEVAGPARTGQAGSVLSRLPLIAWKGATKAYTERLAALLQEKWDAVVLDNIGLAHALPAVTAYRTAFPKTKIVYISHEYEYATRASKYNSYKLNPLKKVVADLDLRKVQQAENELLLKADIVTLINENDRAQFQQIAPHGTFLTLTPGYDGPIKAERAITAATPRRLLMLGGRKSHQKRQILLDWMDVAYDRLQAAGIEIVIAGAMDDDLAAQLKSTYPNAEVMGFVDDLGELMASCRMGVVADTVGGGFKLRLLSQVFERLPIVGLTGAISGLPSKEGEGFVGADDLNALLDLVCEIIDDVPRLNEIQNKVYSDCLAECSWESRGELFRDAILN